MKSGYQKKHAKYNKIPIRVQSKRKGFYVWADEKIICPVCGCCELKKKGRRKRKIILPDEKVKILKIRRLKCERCKKIHHELPDCIVPYKRYSAEAVEKIITGEEADIIIEESTINKIKVWWTYMKHYIDNAKASLIEKYGIIFEEIKKLPEIVRMLVNTNLWPITRSACESG